MRTLLIQFIKFARYHKKMWMLPIVGILFLLGFAMIAAQGSAVMPFIYALF